MSGSASTSFAGVAGAASVSSTSEASSAVPDSSVETPPTRSQSHVSDGGDVSDWCCVWRSLEVGFCRCWCDCDVCVFWTLVSCDQNDISTATVR